MVQLQYDLLDTDTLAIRFYNQQVNIDNSDYVADHVLIDYGKNDEIVQLCLDHISDLSPNHGIPRTGFDGGIFPRPCVRCQEGGLEISLTDTPGSIQRPMIERTDDSRVYLLWDDDYNSHDTSSNKKRVLCSVRCHPQKSIPSSNDK